MPTKKSKRGKRTENRNVDMMCGKECPHAGTKTTKKIRSNVSPVEISKKSPSDLVVTNGMHGLPVRYLATG